MIHAIDHHINQNMKDMKAKRKRRQYLNPEKEDPDLGNGDPDQGKID